MKLNLPDDEKQPLDSSRAVRADIRTNTLAFVLNGVFVCFDMNMEFYIAAAVSGIVMLSCILDLLKLWDQPCNSSR